MQIEGISLRNMLKSLAKSHFHKVKNLYFENFVELPDNYFLKKPFYISQFHGDDYWDKRACGIACIYMIIKTLDKSSHANISRLIQECLALNGYNEKGDTGWHHISLISLLNRHNIKAFSKKYMPVKEVLSEISKNRYAISSIRSNTGGHLILIYGFDEKSVYYHDPFNGHSLKTSYKNFEKMFNNKAIIVKSK